MAVFNLEWELEAPRGHAETQIVHLSLEFLIQYVWDEATESAILTRSGAVGPAGLRIPFKESLVWRVPQW